MTLKIDQHLWPDADGEDGQTLVTDGAGNLSWSDIDVAQQGITIIVPGVLVDGTYMALPIVPAEWRMDRFMAHCRSGSCTLSVNINGSPIGDLTELDLDEVTEVVDLTETIPPEASITYSITNAAVEDVFTVMLYTPV